MRAVVNFILVLVQRASASSLTLDFRAGYIWQDRLLESGRKEEVKLNFKECLGIEQLPLTAQHLKELSNLQTLNINLDGTQVQDVAELGKCIGHLVNLHSFALRLSGTNVEDVAELGKGIGHLV